MGYATRLGRARISSSNPQAAAVCDRCGIIYNHVDLRWQFDFAGTGIINKRLLVCETCNDVPQNQLKALVIPPDPIPVVNPRPFNFEATRTDKRITIGPTITDPVTSLQRRTGDQRITEDKQDRIVQKNGDDMLKPNVVRRARVTRVFDKRITQKQDLRVTQLMPNVPPPPLPYAPEPGIDAIRVTQLGLYRLSQDGRVRVPSKSLDVWRIRLTENDGQRFSEDGRIRISEDGPLSVLKGRTTTKGDVRLTQTGQERGSLVNTAAEKNNG